MMDCNVKSNRPVSPRSLRRVAATLAFAAAAAGCSMPSWAGPASGVGEREYADAVQSFREGRTSDAFGRFIDLANGGDVDAARIALFMHSYGAKLYGKYWEAAPHHVAYWTSLVRDNASSTRPVAEFQPMFYPNPKVKLAGKPAKPSAVKTVAAGPQER